jgi:hypothetical protein
MVGGLKLLSSCLLDVFPVSACFETKHDEVEPHLAVDCYDLEVQQISPKKKKSPLEASLPVVKSQAAANSSFRMKKTKDWVKSQLGLLRTELDRALIGMVEGLVVGMDLTPKGLQNKANFLGHAGLGVRLDPGLGPESDPFLDPVSNMVSSHISRPVSPAGTFSFPVRP